MFSFIQFVARLRFVGTTKRLADCRQDWLVNPPDVQASFRMKQHENTQAGTYKFSIVLHLKVIGPTKRWDVNHLQPPDRPSMVCRNGRNGYIPMMLLYPPWNLPMSEAPIPVTHLPSRKVVFLRCEPCRDLPTASLEPKIRVWNLLGFWDTVPTRECVYIIYIRGFQ